MLYNFYEELNKITQKSPSEKPVFKPKIEIRTFHLRSRNSNHSTAKFVA